MSETLAGIAIAEGVFILLLIYCNLKWMRLCKEALVELDRRSEGVQEDQRSTVEIRGGLVENGPFKPPGFIPCPRCKRSVSCKYIHSSMLLQTSGDIVYRYSCVDCGYGADYSEEQLKGVAVWS